MAIDGDKSRFKSFLPTLPCHITIEPHEGEKRDSCNLTQERTYQQTSGYDTELHGVTSEADAAGHFRETIV